MAIDGVCGGMTWSERIVEAAADQQQVIEVLPRCRKTFGWRLGSSSLKRQEIVVMVACKAFWQ